MKTSFIFKPPEPEPLSTFHHCALTVNLQQLEQHLWSLQDNPPHLDTPAAPNPPLLQNLSTANPALPLAKMDIIAAQQSFELCNEAKDENEELQKALCLSLSDALEYGQEMYENFVSHLFVSTLDVLLGMLKSGSLNSKLSPILQLLLDLIWNLSSISLQNEWA